MKRTIEEIKLFKEMIGMLIYFDGAKGSLVALEPNENGPLPHVCLWATSSIIPEGIVS